MKRIITALLAAALLCGATIAASAAEYHPNNGNMSWARGAYVTGSAADFRPVGDVEIQWLPDAAARLDLSDGIPDDWADLKAVSITPENMISWIGYGNKSETGGEGDFDPDMPANWQTDVYFAADRDSFYIAGYIVDDRVVPGVDAANYGTGDAIQIQIDFGEQLARAIEEDPEWVSSLSRFNGIFYSFCYAGDGAPIAVWRQESDDDRILNEEDGVRGATCRTERGWSFELAIPWQVLFDGYAMEQWSEYFEDTDIYVNEASPLSIGMCISYLNHTYRQDDSTSGVNWAACTSNGILHPETDGPIVSWDIYDMGMHLSLPLQEGMEFSSPNIQVSTNKQTVPVNDTAIDDTSTDAPATDSAASDVTLEGEPAGEAPAETLAPNPFAGGLLEGCVTSVSAAGLATALTLLTGAAWVFKKKD